MPIGRSATRSRAFAKLSLTEAVAAIREVDLLAGQALRDEGSLKVVGRTGGLWVATTQGDKSCETELQLTGRKVKDYHCECSTFDTESQCGHLAALLAVVALRKQAARPARGATRKRTQMASVKKLLQSVEDADLRSFVQDYAKSHADFALDLRVRFAEALPLANRFEQVIKNLLRRTSDQYGPSQAKRISAALAQFAEQRERYVAERAWLDLFELNTTLVPRLIIIVAKADRINVDLGEYVGKCLDELATLATSNPPPVLLERTESWLKGELERGAYFRVGVDGAIARLQDALAGDDGDAALKILSAANDRYGLTEERLGAQMQLYYTHDRSEDAERLLIEHLDRPELVSAALQAEVARGRLSRAVRLGEAALRRQGKSEDKLRLQRFLLASAAAADQPDLAIAHGPLVAVADASVEAVLAVADSLPDDKVDELLELTLAAVMESNIRAEQKEVLAAELLLRLDQITSLEALMYRSTTQSNLAVLLPKLSGRLDDTDYALLLDTKIREHLSDKFGRAPADWVATLLDQVARRSRTDVTAKLVATLRRDFKQRPALLDALDSALL